MAKVKVNIFYVISAVCTLLLVAYLWLMFLPSFADSPDYPGVRTIVFILTILVLAAAGIQVFLAIEKEKESK